MTLAEIIEGDRLYDARTGQTIVDADFNPDSPRDYVVLRELPGGGHAVRGPSGQIDHTTPGDESMLHRDAE